MSRVDGINKRLLRNVIYPLVGNTTTWSNDLENVGQFLFGSDFGGVYPADIFMKKRRDGVYYIVNLDKSHENGSHWIGLYKKDNKYLVYDSFGRRTKNIIDLEELHYDDTEYDAEQNISQSDCGARCISFLLICKHWGYDLAQDL